MMNQRIEHALFDDLLSKALRARFGKKLVHQRCAIHKSRNLQRHLAKPYRPEAHRRLMTA
jgi:putative transposase